MRNGIPATVALHAVNSEAVVFEPSQGGSVFVFHAKVSSSRTDFENTLRHRIGGRLFDNAMIADCDDLGDPIVSASVSPAIDDMLIQIAADSASPLARGLDIIIEERFAD